MNLSWFVSDEYHLLDHINESSNKQICKLISERRITNQLINTVFTCLNVQYIFFNIHTSFLNFYHFICLVFFLALLENAFSCNDVVSYISRFHFPIYESVPCYTCYTHDVMKSVNTRF